MSLNKAVLDLDTGDLTRLNNQSKFSNSEIKEVFNSDSREEKLDFLEDVAGSSASVIAPTQGVAYDADLEGAKQINLISEGELNTDTDLMVVPKGDIEEGSDYWVVVVSNTFMKYFKEVGKDIWETVKERNMEYDGQIPSRTGFEYSYEFRESYALSNNDGNTVICPIPSDLETRDYLAVDFEYLESAVRVSREGGGFRGSWFKGKTVEWKTEKAIAMIEVDDGFIMIDYASSFSRESHTDDKMRLGDYVKRKMNNEGELPMVTVLPTEDYEDEQALIEQAESSEMEVTENDLLDRLQNNLQAYQDRYSSDIDISVKIDEDVTEKILNLDPEPVHVTDELVKYLRGKTPVVQKIKVVFEGDQRAFTGSDLKEYGSFEEGDIAEVPVIDKTNLSRTKNRDAILDKLERRTDGYEWQKVEGEEFVFEPKRDDISVKLFYDPQQKKDFVVPEKYIENYDEFEEKIDTFGISLSSGEYEDGRGVFFDSWNVSDFMKEYAQFRQDGMEQTAKDYVRNYLSDGKEITDEEIIEQVSSTMDVSEEEVEEAIEELYDMNEISLNKSGEYSRSLSDRNASYEMSDSGSEVNEVYEDYYELVNMTPGDIEDRMDNMDCVHKASGEDAVEHLKRNKFIQETNKSEWDSKKVPEEFANPNAESRKVVDQAVRTVSFGKRHLGQLENEKITRMEDGCYNSRVEGLKNWAIDPLEISGFSVDEDRSEESEMNDSSVKYDVDQSRSQNRLTSMSDSAVGQGEVPDVESSQGFGKDVFKSQFGNVDTEVYVDHEDAKRIENGVDAKSHLRDLGISDKPNERFVAIYLNGNNEHLGTQVVAMGDQGSVSFDHKSIIRTASMVNARAVIVAHNHPSGNENASDDDLRAIRDLKHDLADVDLDLLDSLVIGGDSIRDISSMRDDTSIW
jgi:DNA repair protein RadC